MEFLKKIVPTIGLLVGIVFVAVGGVLLLGGGLRLAFSEPVPYDPMVSCEFVYDQEQDKNIRRSPEETTSCVERIKNEEIARVRQDNVDGMINGAAFLVVGAFFWIMFRKRE